MDSWKKCGKLMESVRFVQQILKYEIKSYLFHLKKKNNNASLEINMCG